MLTVRWSNLSHLHHGGLEEAQIQCRLKEVKQMSIIHELYQQNQRSDVDDCQPLSLQCMGIQYCHQSGCSLMSKGFIQKVLKGFKSQFISHVI